MSFVNGDNKILYIKVDGSYLPIGCLDTNGISEGADEIDTSTRDNNGWKTSRPVNQFYDISFSGLIESNNLDANKTTFFDLLYFKRSRTLLDWRIGTTDTNYDFGQGYLIDLSNEAPASELVTFSGTLKGYGKPKNYLNEIYSNWETELLDETSGVVSNRRCVLNQINNLL